MRCPWLRIALAVASALAASERLCGFDLTGSSWADGEIVMNLQLGQPAATLLDGSTTWAAVAQSAMTEWNQYITRAKFTAVVDSTAAVGRSNRVNNVIFRADIYGQAFDS